MFRLLLLITLLFSAAPSYAEDGKQNEWHFQLAGYGWLAGQNGSISTFPNMPEVDVDVDFWDDVLGNINGAFFLMGEARKGSVGVLLDLAYTDIELEERTPGQYFSALTSRTKAWMLTGAGYYRLLENSRSSLDVLAGLRYWSLESELGLTSGLLQGGDIDNTKSWIDPMIGVKGLTALGNSDFYLSGALLCGGFGAGADFVGDASLNFGYNWTESIATTIGYRYMIVDYESGNFVYDVDQHGPTVALIWRF